MRKIERDMVEAIRDRRNWRRDNTRVDINADGTIDVTLYQTRIARILPDYCQMRLDTGGWYTVTTKSRMNALLNGLRSSVSIFQESGEWYIYYHDDCSKHWFYDGMSFYAAL